MVLDRADCRRSAGKHRIERATTESVQKPIVVFKIYHFMFIIETATGGVGIMVFVGQDYIN